MARKPSDPTDREVEEAIKFIKELLSKVDSGNLQVALSYGSYIFDRFFHGSREAFSGRGKDSESFKKLVERPEIPELGLDYRTLVYYVNVAIQDRRWQSLISKGTLPQEVRNFGYTKRLRLQPAQPRDEIRIAKKAIRDNLTAAAIGKLVSAANAKTKGGKAPTVPSEYEKQVVRLAGSIMALADFELSDVVDSDLTFAHHSLGGSCKHLKSMVEEVEAEIASRPSIAKFDPNATVDQDALNDLLGKALDAPDIKDILTYLGELPEADAKDWLCELVEAAVRQLDAKDALAKHLGLAVKRKAKGRRRVFVILGQDKELPDTEKMDTASMDWADALIDGLFDRGERIRCALWARSEGDAVAQYTAALGDRAPDLAHPNRELVARPLTAVATRRVVQKTYFDLDRAGRYTSLDEHIEEVARGGKK